MVVKLAANLSFLFKEKEFLDRFAAAAACGKTKNIGCVQRLRARGSVLVVNSLRCRSGEAERLCHPPADSCK